MIISNHHLDEEYSVEDEVVFVLVQSISVQVAVETLCRKALYRLSYTLIQTIVEAGVKNLQMMSEVGEYEDSNKSCQVSKSGSKIREADSAAGRSLPRSPPHTCIPLERSKSFLDQDSRTGCGEQLGPELAKTYTSQKLTEVQSSQHPALWGHSPAKGNALLQESLENQKNALHERRLLLEKDFRNLA
ncbi:hypothetical protein KY290_031131 [Solanum tuberosum]|uniref:Uncharacterized protein n=1 Tax=Solanum tuberosum TaxID=4113 RepID=A0ABQ7U9I6_SOLTU|nr:hypothetical protein KY290_031131 [Solanum tuberosum]